MCVRAADIAAATVPRDVSGVLDTFGSPSPPVASERGMKRLRSAWRKIIEKTRIIKKAKTMDMPTIVIVNPFNITEISCWRNASRRVVR